MLSRIIVAGCGAMGLPMAIALRSAGFDALGFDVRPKSEFPDFQQYMLDSLDGLHSDDILLIVVRDQYQIQDICFGDHAVYKKGSYPQRLIISSTVSPRYIESLHQHLPGDVNLIDAPMSGAPVAARQRNLSFMIGGEKSEVAALMPAFNAMGKNIFHLGETGQGMLAKVLNNYIAACNVISVRKSLAHAEQLGMPADKLLDVVNSSSGSNWFSNRMDAIDWSHENYQPDNTIGILEKDVIAALDVIDNTYQQHGRQHDTAVSRDDFGHALLASLKTIPALPEKN